MKKISELINEEEDILLMSLREEYYNQMIVGTKKYEYRKNYRKVPTKAFIYIPKTIKSIVAMIVFDKPIFGTTAEISAISESENVGSYKDMAKYLNKGKGVAIPIKAMYEFLPIHLAYLKENYKGFTVPQSYCMLHNKTDILNLLKNREILKEMNVDKIHMPKGQSSFNF